jgi:hypothetical protein
MFIQIFMVIVILLVCPSIASEITLPKPAGQYAVGTKAMDITDPTRTQLRDISPRRWMAQVFYPCQSHTKTYPYRPGTLNNGMIDEMRVLAHAAPDAPVLKSIVAPFPLIFFAPGFGGGRQDHTILCEELASHGYVVVSFDHPYVTNYIRFTDGSVIVPTFKDAWKSMTRWDRDYRYQYFDDAMKAAIGDITYMLDHIDLFQQALNRTINEKQIILMGHSFGGNISHTLGFKDKRVTAVVDIDSKITERAIYGRIGVPPNETGVPTLFIRGMMQYQEDLGDQLTKISNAETWLPVVQHGAFSDEPFLALHIPSLAQKTTFSKIYTWLFKIGPQLDTVDTNLGNFTVDQWYIEYKTKIISWLNIQVKAKSGM